MSIDEVTCFNPAAETPGTLTPQFDALGCYDPAEPIPLPTDADTGMFSDMFSEMFD